MNRVNLVLVMHNHQPVGNFGSIFEEVCSKAYEPFLGVMQRYPDIKLVLHYSGELLEWIKTHRPQVFEQIHQMVKSGQVEIIGGGFYEPILVMLPRRDRLGQLRSFARWLGSNLDAEVKGVWLAERVWEQGLVSTLWEAGAEYTVVDDSHFRNAGLREEELDGYFLTEDEGHILKIFPGSERLRYCIPFEHPEKTIDYLRQFAQRKGDALLVYADDGEKFGGWPMTHKHVYEDGWLEQFFQALVKNREWINIITLREAVERLSPRGKVYLPDASYREMMEWALPAAGLIEYEEVYKAVASQPWGDVAKRFLKGGTWRNFRVKYPEAYQMYARMLEVSHKIAERGKASLVTEALQKASKELYKAQCNDAYWHGVFGGLYLPHLRSAVYKHLIEADSLCDTRQGVQVEVKDFDLDTVEEYKLSNSFFSAYFKPDRGGHLYELDYKPRRLNLLNVLCRREEAYHRKILQTGISPAGEGGEKVVSIHDIVPRIEEELRERLHYDSYYKEGLIDHILPLEATLEDCLLGRLPQLSDCLAAAYACQLEKESDRVSLKLSRQCAIHGERDSLLITKQVDMDGVSHALCVTYSLVNISAREIAYKFAVEFSFSLSAGEAEGRYYVLDDRDRMGHLAIKGNFPGREKVSLVDEALGIKVSLAWDKPAEFWIMPITTVSQSEAGFEKVYQGSTVLSLWQFSMKPQERYELRLKKAVEEVRPL